MYSAPHSAICFISFWLLNSWITCHLQYMLMETALEPILPSKRRALLWHQFPRKLANLVTLLAIIILTLKDCEYPKVLVAILEPFMWSLHFQEYSKLLQSPLVGMQRVAYLPHVTNWNRVLNWVLSSASEQVKEASLPQCDARQLFMRMWFLHALCTSIIRKYIPTRTDNTTFFRVMLVCNSNGSTPPYQAQL